MLNGEATNTTWDKHANHYTIDAVILLLRKIMDVNDHKILSNITFKYKCMYFTKILTSMVMYGIILFKELLLLMNSKPLHLHVHVFSPV